MPFRHFLSGNAQWAAEFKAKVPQLAAQLSQAQAPRTLWYTCADSRVSPEMITNSNPGELFVHRNIANVVSTTDLSAMSVLEFAVKVLKVEHIVVTGHAMCGGVLATLSGQPAGEHLDEWLTPVKHLHALQKQGFTCDGQHLDQALPKDQMELDLTKLNIRRSLSQLAQSTYVQARWQDATAPPLTLHGLYLNLDSFKLEVTHPPASSPQEATQAYSIPALTQ
ncbi:hypothetical protein IWQ60_000909 [Tieghemiomyces parasiticus]|uniref:Carbonic anhydrase n=1 Tax=Tieghemiomyces parasiticus TaxID=78921 RepID=A0A9W8ALZ4_9FUNG|nr:hypothetical protein IWQ60_000909 [Tieghemiomyces parasiticus]